MSHTLQGRYFDGHTAEATPASMHIDASGHVQLAPKPLAQSLHVSQLQIDSRISGLPACIRLPGGAVFETTQHEELSACLNHFGKRHGRLHGLESRTGIAIGAVILVFSLAALSYFRGIGLMSRMVAPLVPPRMEQQLGTAVLEQLDTLVLLPSQLSPQRQAELTRLFAPVKERYAGDFQVSLLFREGGRIAANAFALPGGTIVVTDELVALAENDAQLSGVLLHEVGHLQHRHLIRNLLSQSAVAVVTTLIFGDVSGLGALVLALPNVLLQTAFSRDMEREADDFALANMPALHLRSAELGDFLARLEAFYRNCRRNGGERSAASINTCVDAATAEGSTEKNQDAADGWFTYLSTHPATQERIARLQGR